MSAFFIALNKKGNCFSQDIAESMLSTLECYGRDGHELIVKGNFAIGFQRTWTVPEEVNECQPLYNEQQKIWLVFDGRIDNRTQLSSRFGIDVKAQTSDARLIMELYLKVGQRFFPDIVGPFTFALFDEDSQTVIAARDVMGGRFAAYFNDHDQFMISSHEIALAAHPKVGYRFRKPKLASMFAMIETINGSAHLEGLKLLAAGYQLESEIRQNKIEHREFYSINPKKRIHLTSDEDYISEYRRLLDQAVLRRLRCQKPVASMLSGGFDSVPISISAAKALKQQGKQLKAFSWVFDDYPEADERQYSAPVCEDFDIDVSWIKCDDAWPKFDDKLFLNPVMPCTAPYIGFSQKLLKQAQQDRVGVMLSGMGGDLLYVGFDSTLIELIREGRWRSFFAEAKHIYHRIGKLSVFTKRFFVKPLLPALVDWLNKNKIPNISFLSKQANIELAKEDFRQDPKSRFALRSRQYRTVMGPSESEDAYYGRYLDIHYGIERRYPFRDRDLVEFMLAIPSRFLYFEGIPRPIVRKAFENELRPNMLQRRDKAIFSNVINSLAKQDKQLDFYLNNQDATWQSWVKPDYVHVKQSSELDGSLKWMCAYYEFWKKLCYDKQTLID